MASQQKQSRPPRYQYYTFLVYPESAPGDWIERLRNFHIPMYLSQHDCDEDMGHDGKKKEHWHVMTMFDSLKPLDACDEMIASVNGVKPPVNDFVVKSNRAYARYLLHYDDPSKYPYYKDHRVIQLSGPEDYDELIKSKSQQDFEENQTIEDIQDYLEKNEIYNYAAAIRLARKTNNEDWFRCLKVNAYYFHAWCKSHNDPNWHSDMAKVDEILERKGEEKNESDD